MILSTLSANVLNLALLSVLLLVLLHVLHVLVLQYNLQSLLVSSQTR